MYAGDKRNWIIILTIILVVPMFPAPNENQEELNHDLVIFIDKDELQYNPMMKLVHDTVTGNLVDQRKKAALDFDTGRISDIEQEVKKTQQVYDSIKDHIQIINTDASCPFYKLSKHGREAIRFEAFYERNGRKRSIQFPSDILEIIRLELGVMRIRGASANWFVYQDMENYSTADSTQRIGVTYLKCPTLGFKKPMSRTLFTTVYDNTTVHEIEYYMSNLEVRRLKVEILTYLHNNSGEDLTKKLQELEFEIMAIRENPSLATH